MSEGKVLRRRDNLPLRPTPWKRSSRRSIWMVVRCRRSFIERHSTPLLSENAKPPKDAKTALQEWVQGRGLPLPVYEEVGRGGPAHAPVFEISVAVKGFGSAAARGNNKRAGEKLAAEKMLAAIKGKG